MNGDWFILKTFHWRLITAPADKEFQPFCKTRLYQISDQSQSVDWHSAHLIGYWRVRSSWFVLTWKTCWSDFNTKSCFKGLMFFSCRVEVDAKEINSYYNVVVLFTQINIWKRPHNKQCHPLPKGGAVEPTFSHPYTRLEALAFILEEGWGVGHKTVQ